MITSDYVQRALTGVFRMSMHDAKSLSWFEMTADGFFRSFWAIALSAPLYAYALLGMVRAAEVLPVEGGKETTITIFLAVHLLYFLGSSVVFLIAMIPLSRLLDFQPRYTAFAIAYNWGTLAIHLIGVIPVAAFGIGLITAADMVAFAYVGLGFGLYLRFASFSVALGAQWPTAASLTLIEGLSRWTFWLLITSPF